jgi:DNA polymerase-3 subunit delta
MLSRKRLCVVKDAQGLGTQGFKLLEGYLAAPSPRTCLVLAFGGGSKPNLKLNPEVALVDFTVAPHELSEILAGEARRLGVEITPGAARLLLQYVGGDIGAALFELEKLSLCIEEGDKIREEHVEKLTEKTQHDDVFKLLSAVFSKNKQEALRCLLELEARAEDPISILNTLAWRVRIICKARELMENNASQAEIARALSVSTRAVYYLKEQARRFDSKDLKVIVDKLYDTDRRIKSSSVSPRYALAQLVLEICSLGNPV